MGHKIEPAKSGESQKAVLDRAAARENIFGAKHYVARSQRASPKAMILGRPE